MEEVKSIRLPADLINAATKCAKASLRSTPKQIEYWVKLGKAAEDNPDLPIEFIVGSLKAKAEIENGLGEDFSLIDA